MGEDSADRGGVGEERDQAHLALAARAGEGAGLVDPREQAGPVDRGAVVSGKRERGIRHERRRGRRLEQELSGVGGNARAQCGMRGEHPEIVMPMPARRRDQRGEAIEQFERGEGEFGLAVGQGPGQGVADRLIGAVPREPGRAQ